MMLGVPQRIQHANSNHTITILDNDKTLETVDTAKILGAHIARNLSWTAMKTAGPKALLKSLNRKILMLRRASQYLDTSQRRLFANSIFLSKAT